MPATTSDARPLPPAVPMDPRAARLKAPEECEQLALNVQDRLPELAQQARRRAVELRAESHGAATVVEREALQAVYAYERVLSAKRGKSIRASRTWPMIKSRGIIPAVEHIVNRKDVSSGYTTLAEMGMKDFAFEAVVCRHPDVFQPETVAHCQRRLQTWDAPPNRPQQ